MGREIVVYLQNEILVINNNELLIHVATISFFKTILPHASEQISTYFVFYYIEFYKVQTNL
jgi:hypothetical protein